jgi:hypothetical protein
MAAPRIIFPHPQNYSFETCQFRDLYARTREADCWQGVVKSQAEPFSRPVIEFANHKAPVFLSNCYG